MVSIATTQPTTRASPTKSHHIIDVDQTRRQLGLGLRIKLGGGKVTVIRQVEVDISIVTELLVKAQGFDENLGYKLERLKYP